MHSTSLHRRVAIKHIKAFKPYQLPPKHRIVVSPFPLTGQRTTVWRQSRVGQTTKTTPRNGAASCGPAKLKTSTMIGLASSIANCEGFLLLLELISLNLLVNVESSHFYLGSWVSSPTLASSNYCIQLS